jgi:hypothetical protein
VARSRQEEHRESTNAPSEERLRQIDERLARIEAALSERA